MFAFVMLGLLATDLAFTLKNRATNDLENQAKFNGLMNVLWSVVYWGNLIFGSGVIKFFQYYWVSGHFSVKSRIKYTLKKLLTMIIAAAVLLAVLVAAGLYFMKKDKFVEICSVAILLMSNVYGTLLLVILLSYGLVFLPFTIWKQSSNEKVVYEKLMRAE